MFISNTDNNEVLYLDLNSRSKQEEKSTQRLDLKNCSACETGQPKLDTVSHGIRTVEEVPEMKYGNYCLVGQNSAFSYLDQRSNALLNLAQLFKIAIVLSVLSQVGIARAAQSCLCCHIASGVTC